MVLPRKDFLVETSWLQANSDDPRVRIVDPDDAIPVQVATDEQFADAMSRAGIGDENLVIVYDSHPASTFATRLWWARRYYGHTDVVVLDGWIPEVAARGPLDRHRFGASPGSRVRPRRQASLRASLEDVRVALGDSRFQLVDARDPGQYTGAVGRGDNRRGHIPGAVNVSREDLVDPSTGTWHSAEELASRLAAEGLNADGRIITYCNGGVAAASVLFGLAMAGYPFAGLYDGSWNGWSARPDPPVELDGQVRS